MILLLDTNILLHLIRQDATGKRIMRDYQIYSSAHRPVISEVSIGELKSLATQRQWGQKLQDDMLDLLNSFTVMPIGFPDVYDLYAEIDAFSQAKYPHQIANFTARNMGKNDLWIAATASVLGAKLLTTDADFEHLAGVFLDLQRLNTA